MFVNLTPHDIHVIMADGSIVTFERSGTIARCSVDTELVDRIEGIELSRATFGTVTDMPDIVQGTYYIVSMLVRNALSYRHDLVSPGELVRDEKGNVIGCKGFTCN
jgi:hypothetical protein